MIRANNETGSPHMSKQNEKSFFSSIYAVVSKIPKGCVASYGQVALLAGFPGAARAVGNALHKNPDPEHIPCHRVVHASGELSKAFVFGGIQIQKELLEGEGVSIPDSRVEMSRYQWKTDIGE